MTWCRPPHTVSPTESALVYDMCRIDETQRKHSRATWLQVASECPPLQGAATGVPRRLMTDNRARHYDNLTSQPERRKVHFSEKCTFRPLPPIQRDLIRGNTKKLLRNWAAMFILWLWPFAATGTQQTASGIFSTLLPGPCAGIRRKSHWPDAEEVHIYDAEP